MLHIGRDALHVPLKKTLKAVIDKGVNPNPEPSLRAATVHCALIVTLTAANLTEC